MSTTAHEVIAFVAEFTGLAREKIKQDSTLLGDLRVDGVDGGELIEAFGTKFSVDIRNFRLNEHFGPEGLPLSAPFQMLWYLISHAQEYGGSRLRQLASPDRVVIRLNRILPESLKQSQIWSHLPPN
jgi:acyl carrier protein